MVDLDRLHKVVNGELSGRGCGKTYAQVQNLAGMVGLGIPRIIVIVTRISDLQVYLLKMWQEVFSEHGFEGKRLGQKVFHVHNTRIAVMLEGDNNYIKELGIVRGFEGGIVHMRHWD